MIKAKNVIFLQITKQSKIELHIEAKICKKLSGKLRTFCDTY